MRKNLTEIVFILDRSGSMSGLEADTIGGFNSMIEKQKKENGEALISTVLFDNVSEVIHDRVPVQKVEPMTDRDYSVRGCTALLDAIGGAIHHIGNVHKYARNEDVPEHTLFVITTDGMENASRRYDSEKVKKMIERQKEKYGWEFLFLGANIDAVETARHFGIGADRAVNYHSDHEGTQLNYEVLSEAVSAVRCSVPLGTNWKKRIDEDYNSRKDGRKYDAFQKAKDKPGFKAKHEAELVIFEAARSTLLAMQGDEKLPSLKTLQAEQAQLFEEQERLYAERNSFKKEAKQIETIKSNVDTFLSPSADHDRDHRRSTQRE